MKLKELLVQALPEFGGWPDECVFAAYRDGFVQYYIDDHGLMRPKPFYLTRLAILPDDYIDAIVTREQYEAALAAHNDGWISWSGGECPVDGSVMVELRLRDNTDATDIAENWFWSHCGNEADIIAYRLHNSASQKLEWDGKGLPPVGCECQIILTAIGGDGDLGECEILFVGNEMLVWRQKSTFAEGSGLHRYMKFLPIRSEADKKRKETIDLMDKRFKGVLAAGSTESMAIFATVYDTILDGKIPSGPVE